MPRTDVLGMVQFEPDPQLRGLIVVNGAGYASASWKTLTMDPTLRMQPWGSLEVSFNPASRVPSECSNSAWEIKQPVVLPWIERGSQKK
jgi:hypothetical protein